MITIKGTSLVMSHHKSTQVFHVVMLTNNYGTQYDMHCNFRCCRCLNDLGFTCNNDVY